MIGTLADLMLLAHYEDAAQLIPLALLALGIAAVAVQGLRPSAMAVKTLRVVAGLMLAAGLAGMGFHFNGAAAFQLEIDPTLSLSALVGKVARAQSPPLMAPGAMMQLGLLGLVYTFRHPAIGTNHAFKEVQK
jgi:hypothetical protein